MKKLIKHLLNILENLYGVKIKNSDIDVGIEYEDSIHKYSENEKVKLNGTYLVLFENRSGVDIKFSDVEDYWNNNQNDFIFEEKVEIFKSIQQTLLSEYSWILNILQVVKELPNGSIKNFFPLSLQNEWYNWAENMFMIGDIINLNDYDIDEITTELFPIPPEIPIYPVPQKQNYKLTKKRGRPKKNG